MDKAKEILAKMKDARTWKESEVSMAEIVDLIHYFMSQKDTPIDDSAEIKRLKTKIERLTESNKQLMAENKKLKGAK